MLSFISSNSINLLRMNSWNDLIDSLLLPLINLQRSARNYAKERKRTNVKRTSQLESETKSDRKQAKCIISKVISTRVTRWPVQLTRRHLKNRALRLRWWQKLWNTRNLLHKLQDFYKFNVVVQLQQRRKKQSAKHINKSRLLATIATFHSRNISWKHKHQLDYRKGRELSTKLNRNAKRTKISAELHLASNRKLPSFLETISSISLWSWNFENLKNWSWAKNLQERCWSPHLVTSIFS